MWQPRQENVQWQQNVLLTAAVPERQTAVLVTTESETSGCRNEPSSGIQYVMPCHNLLLSVLPEDGPFWPKHVDSMSVRCM